MAKYTRSNVGAIYKSKLDGQSDYLEFQLPPGEVVEFKNGDKLQIESKSYKLKSLEQGHNEGRIKPESYVKMKEYTEKMPEWVRAQVVLLRKNS